MPLQRDDGKHRRKPSRADRHGLPSAEPLPAVHQIGGRDPRLRGVAAPLDLADPPAGQDHRVTWLELRRFGMLDCAGEVDPRNMRIISYQATDALEDHSVL